MRIFRLCLTAGIVALLGAMVAVPAMASSDGGSDESALIASQHGKDAAPGAGVGKDGGQDNGWDDNDDNDTGAGTGTGVGTGTGTGVGKDAGVGTGAGAGVPVTGGGAGVGKDGGQGNGWDDDDDDNDNGAGAGVGTGAGVGKGAGAEVPVTGAGGLASSGVSGVMLFSGMLAFFGAVAASGLAFLRRR